MINGGKVSSYDNHVFDLWSGFMKWLYGQATSFYMFSSNKRVFVGWVLSISKICDVIFLHYLSYIFIRSEVWAVIIWKLSSDFMLRAIYSTMNLTFVNLFANPMIIIPIRSHVYRYTLMKVLDRYISEI